MTRANKKVKYHGKNKNHVHMNDEKKMFVVVKIIEENEKLRLYANVDYSVILCVCARASYMLTHTQSSSFMGPCAVRRHSSVFQNKTSGDV